MKIGAWSILNAYSSIQADSLRIRYPRPIKEHTRFPRSGSSPVRAETVKQGSGERSEVEPVKAPK